MPIPQRHSRPRPSLYSASLPTSTSPLSTSLPKSSNPLKSLNIKPGYAVPRKTTLHFIASPREERVAIEEDEGERRGRELERQLEGLKVGEEKGVDTGVKKPVGLGELIAASKGSNRPPRAPIAHQLGFDLIPNPTNNILIQEDLPLPLASSSSPSSLPALSRSVATSTGTSISPATDFPDLPSARLNSRFPGAGGNHRTLSRIDSELDQETGEWDMLDEDTDDAQAADLERKRERESTAWVGIETGGNPSGGTSEDEELIFMDEESLMAIKVREERARRKVEVEVGGKEGEEGREGRGYAQVLKGPRAQGGHA